MRDALPWSASHGPDACTGGCRSSWIAAVWHLPLKDRQHHFKLPMHSPVSSGLSILCTPKWVVLIPWRNIAAALSLHNTPTPLCTLISIALSGAKAGPVPALPFDQVTTSLSFVFAQIATGAGLASLWNFCCGMQSDLYICFQFGAEQINYFGRFFYCQWGFLWYIINAPRPDDA